MSTSVQFDDPPVGSSPSSLSSAVSSLNAFVGAAVGSAWLLWVPEHIRLPLEAWACRSPLLLGLSRLADSLDIPARYRDLILVAVAVLLLSPRLLLWAVPLGLVFVLGYICRTPVPHRDEVYLQDRITSRWMNYSENRRVVLPDGQVLYLGSLWPPQQLDRINSGTLSIPSEINAPLQRLVDNIIRDYINSWYSTLNRSQSPDFPNAVKSAIISSCATLGLLVFKSDYSAIVAAIFRTITDHMREYKKFEASNLSLDQYIKKSPRSPFARHVSQQERIAELRELVLIVLNKILPSHDRASPSTVPLVQEIVATSILEPIIQTICEPDFINLQIVSHYQKSSEASSGASSDNPDPLQGPADAKRGQRAGSSGVPKPGEVYVKVLEARKLPNPTSSVLYCVVTVGKEGDKTTKVNAESNPLWLEEFSFPWTTRSAQSVPGILVDIYRSRLLRDELIGSVFIPIHAVTNRYLKQWIPLESSDQRGALGEAEILIEAIYVNPIEIDDDDDPRPALQSSLQSRHEPRNVPDVKPKFNPRNLVLSDVLDRNEAMMEFIQFMESCQVGAYAQYFIMVNSFQQLANAAETSPAIFRSDAIDVYDMFFSKDAKYPISIPGDSEIAARVLDRIVSDPSPNVFEEITEVLKAHVQQQYWQAFKESEFFEEYLATTGSSPTAASMPAPPRNDGTPTPPPRSLLEESIIQEPAIRPIDPFEVVEPARGTPPVDIAGRGDALDRLNATEPTHIIEPAAVAVPETVPSRPSSNASPALPPRQTNLPAANTLAPDVSTAPPPKPPRRRAETSPPPAAPSSEPALPPPKPPRPVRSATIQKAPEVTSSTKPLTDNLDFLSSEIPGNLFTAPAAAVQEGDGSILAPDPDPVPAPAAVPVLDGSSNVGTAQPNLLGDDEPLSAAVQPTPAHPASRDIDIDTNADIGTNPSSAAPVQSHTMDAVAPRASPRTFDSEYRRNLRSAIAAGQDEALAISIALESSSGYEAIQYKRSKAEIESRIEILGRFLAEEERYLQAAAESGWALPEDPVSLVGVRVTIQDITGDGSDDAPVDGRDGVLSNFAGTLGAVSNKGLLFLVQVNRVGSQQRWSLYRSYADWVLLSDVLKPQFAFIRSNPVPNRPRISHAKSRETLAVELEKWTNMLLMDRDLSKTAQLRAFLLEQTLEALSGGQRPSIPSEAGGNGPDSLQQSFVRALKKGGSMLQKLGFETDSEDDWDSSDPRLIEKDSSLYMHPNHSGSAASITGQSLSHDRAATAPVIGRQPSLRSLAPEQDSVLDPPKMARASSRGKMAPYVNPSVAGAKTILRATSPSVIPDRKLSYVVRFSPEDTKVVLESAVQTIEEVLNLNDPNQWILQKGLHAAKALLRRTYGTTISNYVENYLTDLSQPAEVASYIELAIRAGWPNEAAAQGNGTAAGLRNARSQQDLAGSSFVAPPSSLSSEPPRPRTELEMEDTKLSAKTVLLKDFVSQLEAVSRVFGKSNVTSGCARVFNMLQVKELNAILTVSILRAVIDEVFSDVPRSSS